MIRTLNDAIYSMYQSDEPPLPYEQVLDIRTLFLNTSYVLHHPESETLRITFPRECYLISNMRNNRSCKMVYYKKEEGFLKEIQIHANTIINVEPGTEITVYTRSKPDLIITYDVHLKKSVRSKL